MNRISASPQAIAETLLSQLPTLSLEEKKVSLAIYQLLAEGIPVSLERLAEVAAMPVGYLQHMLGNWTGVYFDEAQHITGYGGALFKPSAPQDASKRHQVLRLVCLGYTVFTRDSRSNLGGLITESRSAVDDPLACQSWND